MQVKFKESQGEINTGGESKKQKEREKERSLQRR
jgi:hypothetical protein